MYGYEEMDMIRPLASIALCFALSGCLLYPYDGQFVESRWDPIPVTGCLPLLSDWEVEIRAWLPPSRDNLRGVEETVATLRTGTQSAYFDPNFELGPVDWYCFNTTVTVPSHLWEGVWGAPPNPVVTHHRTYIAAFFKMPAGGAEAQFNTYRNPPEQCPLPLGWPQVSGDADGDGVPDFGAYRCALQKEWVEVNGW
jgi:hypothetical protein